MPSTEGKSSGKLAQRKELDYGTATKAPPSITKPPSTKSSDSDSDSEYNENWYSVTYTTDGIYGLESPSQLTLEQEQGGMFADMWAFLTCRLSY
ncbi:uncharacterized protein ARMOST_12782 [Armillaria ostoyae]|uniref:Uncharacterized protein n=1 Tax=Armillaria ostoyae TaxID=47428 RepID=A0A284RKY3_ARMOS|nr:uncharacterized protein ARMOST_12782 [Armillaria ostoyae]